MVIPALRDQQAVVTRAIASRLLLGDPARPPAGEGAVQGLGLADAAEGRASAFLDDAVDAGALGDREPARWR